MTHRFITAREIADETRIPKATIYRMIRDGRIPGGFCFIPNSNNGLRVVRSEYEAWFAQCRLTARGPKLKD